jgi:hypothetical protein
MPRLVDNHNVTQSRPKSIPLPCALLALSVAMCITAAGPVEASTLRSTNATQAEQRETIEHLLGAIQQAAKKLTDQLTGQSAMLERQHTTAFFPQATKPCPTASDDRLTVLFLREALLNLPPPTC